ncbi:MAG: hypothetical protein H3C56_08410, partial [Chitinophagaceae bacterium]|nr:hypothetical protein [Chitinophagaceae bacterium]
MKFTKHIFYLTLITLPVFLQAQSSYLTLGGKEEWLLNRMDIKANSNALSFSSIKPYNRKNIVHQVDYWDSLYNAGNKAAKRFSEIDKYNMQRFLMANSEWSKPKEIYKSEKSILKYFYTNRANMVDMQNEDFILI